MNLTERSILTFALIAMLATSGNAQTSGLSSRQPVGAYLNGNLPANITNSGYKVVEAFPALRFKDPIRLVQRPGTNQLWVLCQGGEIWSFDKFNAATKSLLLDITDVCVGHDEGEGDSGLLGIAFHPQFGQVGSPNRGYVYLWYSYRPAGDENLYFSYNRLSRFTLADGATTISRATEMVMINQYDRKTWHNGGGMFFGPDGFLYITNGDEGDEIHGTTGTYGNAQKINDGLFSGVLRIDVDMNPARSHPIRRQPRGSAAPPAGWPGSYSQNYYIPNDNPWIDPGGAYLEEFYAIGLRSPHSLAYDGVTGKALIAETGQGEQEEIDVLAKGANYQWAFLEGTVPGPAPGIIGPGTSTPPIYVSANRTVDGSAVIGGWVYRGSQFAADLGGKYVFGDFISNKIWALDWQAPGAPRRWLVTVPRIPGSTTGITNVNVDAANELYITVHGPEGRIYKLASTGATSTPPATLSGTGAFTNLATLTPSAGIVPFDVNSSLWSDGAEKYRWIALPNNGAPYGAAETVAFAATGQWSFPAGTVTIKHFELPVSDTNPALKKRLETRFLVRTLEGWYGLTYRWRADGSDADLVPEAGASENIPITQADGSTRVQRWDYPSRENCMGCHNQLSGFALGANTRQLNGSTTYPLTGITANQLATWSAIGMFDTPPTTAQISGFARTVEVTDTSASLEQRMRSYLDVNCAHCHQPGGALRTVWDGRFDTPLAQQGIVNVAPDNDFGIPGSKIIMPGDKDKSLIYIRMNDEENAQVQMPPLARNVRHEAAVSVLRLWIAQLAGGAGNQAPDLAQPANQVSSRGTAASLQISATDPDGNALAYSATGLPAGLSISTTTGFISGTVATNAASSYVVTVAVTDGLLSASKSFTWTTSAPPVPVGSLTATDIGPANSPGSTSYSAGNNTFTVQSYGSQIHDTADDFHFAYLLLAGDGEISARITSQSNSSEWADAGIMFRESLATGSRHAYVGITPAHGFAAKARAATGGTTNYIDGPPLNAAPNNWVRLVRSGNVITSYTSANGTAWTLITTVTYADLPPALHAGLAVASVDDAVSCTATFDNVQITGTPAPGYPSSWNEWLGIQQLTAANVDADFNSDLMEYVLGEDPRSGVTGGGLTLMKGADGRFGVGFRLPSVVSDVDYVIETSADLQSWTVLSATPITVDGADGFRSVTYPGLDSLLGSSGSATVFVRLRVTHRGSGSVATGEPLSLQRIPFATGSHTMGYANVKPPVFAGIVTGMTNDSLNLGAVIVVAPALRYYLEVRNGALAGHRFDIANFSGSSAVIDLASVRNTASVLPNLSGASIVIRPHVKLDEVLDKWTLVGGRSSGLSDKASFYEGSGYVSYWLFNLTPTDPSKAVWVRAGDASLVDAGGRIVAPAEGMFVSTVRDTSMILGGNVRTNPFVQVVRPGQNFLAQPFPLWGSPATNGLSASNGLRASRQKSSADQLSIWRGDVTGGSASFSTLWYAQIGSAALWVSADNASLADQSAAAVFQPHRATFLKRSQPVTSTILMPVRWTAAP